MRVARAIHVQGQVQGVCFRDYAVQVARRLGVTGWVRNRGDGSVEALAVGEADHVEQFVGCLRQGSPGSRVDRVEVRDVPLQEFAGFVRRATA